MLVGVDDVAIEPMADLKSSPRLPPIFDINSKLPAMERNTTIRDWLARCADAHKSHRSEVLALVPVATNTKHWKRHVWGTATGIAFLYDTRLKFLVSGKPSEKGAPMSCAMVYWGGDFDLFSATFTEFGAVVDVRPLMATSDAIGKGRHERR